MIDKDTEQHLLHPSPDDAVSRVAYSADSARILVSTWGGTLAVHTSATGTLQAEAPRHTCAFLDSCWHPVADRGLLAAALDGSVLMAEFTEAAITSWQPLGHPITATANGGSGNKAGGEDGSSCRAAARAVVATAETQSPLALSASWDGSIRLWDLNNTGKSVSPFATIDAGGKVYGAATCGSNAAIVITSQRRVRVLDFRNTASFLHDRQPPTLTYQLRGISASPDGSYYAVGSTEGRVAVEWLDNSSKPSFSFRCHRVDGLAFPVNTISHNRRYASFATGGGDGHVAFWDGEARKRIAQYSRYPTSIASIDFDHLSQNLAIAVSYSFEEGEKDHPPDEVHIRNLDDSHIATKRSKEQRDNATMG